MPLPPATLDKVEHRVAMFAVHAVYRYPLTEQRGAELQRSEVQGDQHHALPCGRGIVQMLQTFHVGQPGQALTRPPPGHGHFK